MATHYGGIGDTSMNDPESQDIDSDSQKNYQGDVNDQKHVEFDPPVVLQSHLASTLNLQNGMVETNCQRQGQ